MFSRDSAMVYWEQMSQLMNNFCKIFHRYLHYAMNESIIKAQDVSLVFSYISNYNPAGRYLAWNFIKKKWDYMKDRWVKFYFKCFIKNALNLWMAIIYSIRFFHFFKIRFPFFYIAFVSFLYFLFPFNRGFVKPVFLNRILLKVLQTNSPNQKTCKWIATFQEFVWTVIKSVKRKGKI